MTLEPSGSFAPTSLRFESQAQIQSLTLPAKLDQVVKQLSDKLTKDGVSPYEAPDLHGTLIAERVTPLISQDLLGELERFGATGNPDALLIKNVPIDAHIPTEGTIHERLSAKGTVSESSLLALATLMRCRLQSIAREQRGNVIQNISPIIGMEDTESALSTNSFRLHTDDAPQDRPCDFVMMLCLEGDEHASTSLFPIKRIINDLPPETISQMKRSEFEFSSSASSQVVSKGRHPIISHNCKTDEFRVRLCQNQNMGRLRGLTPGANQALQTLDKSFEKLLKRPENTEKINLKPGEALIVNNGIGHGSIQGALHGRAGEIKNFGRWLQRGLAERVSS